jgi:WD40 repeat protein
LESPVKKIFLSSPGDVSEERALAERVLNRLTEEFKDALQLELFLWEHEPIFAHTNFQEQIPRPSQCDLVICILWSRLGTRLPVGFASHAAGEAPTGTEFEVADALSSFRRVGRPNLLIYRRTSPPQINIASADARDRLEQYERLDNFCRRSFYDENGSIIVAHHSYEESHEFEKKLGEHVRRWIDRQTGEVESRPRWPHGSPYRGLLAFEAEHRDIYFGRTQAVSELVSRIRETERGASGPTVSRFLLIQGISGNGKSSLVRAGLLPLLEGRAVEGIGLWLQVAFKPTFQPSQHLGSGVVGALIEAVVKAIPSVLESYPDVAQLAMRIRAAPEESAARLDGFLAQEALRRELRPNQLRLIIFIDQLEELFEKTFSETDRDAFISILHALTREGRIWVIATLRSDFGPRLEEYPLLVQMARNGHLIVLGPPRADELADMIREPAFAAGLRWEDRDGVPLNQAILRDAIASPESLPLLEYALDQLYEAREGRRLTYAAYSALGGLQGGISQAAEAVLVSQEDLAAALPQILRGLVSVNEGGTAMRRYALLAEFDEDSPERVLLEALIAQRLCVTDRQGMEAIVTFAHESLLRAWPRLRAWLVEEGALIQARDLLIGDARRWEKNKERRDWLVTAPDRLTAIGQVFESRISLPPLARQFGIESMRRARWAARLRQGVIASMAVLALVATVFGFYSLRERDVASEAIAAQFEAKSWDLLQSGNRLAAARYALARSELTRDFSERSHPLLAAVASEVSDKVVLAGHTDVVTSAVFSPDGKRIVTTSQDHTARVWDAVSGTPLAQLPHEGPVWYASFSPDSNQIITSSASNRARIWDVTSGKLIKDLTHGDKVTSNVLSASYSPDGSHIVTVSSDGTAWIWDLHTATATAQLQDGIETLDMIKMVQARVVAELRSPGNQSNIVPLMSAIRQAAFSPDSRSMVTSSANGEAAVWDALSGRRLYSLKHDGPVSSASFSLDGTRIVTASKDSTARMWASSDGRELARLDHSSPVSQAIFSPDGKTIATASDDGTARIWDATQNLEMVGLEHDHQTRRDNFLSANLRAMKSAIAKATVRTPDLATSREVRRFQHDGRVRQVMFSTDGQNLLTASEDHTARLWNIESGDELSRITYATPVATAAIAPNGRQILSTSQSNVVQLWNVTHKFGPRLKHDADIKQLAFSSDGKLVLTASNDRTVRIWKSKDGSLISRLQHDDAVRMAEFSSDAKRVVSVGQGTFAYVWDVQTGRALARFYHEQGKVRNASFSPDGSQVVTCGEDLTARVWDVQSQRELARFTHESGILNSAVFSPDGVRVLTASADHTARLWDMRSGNELVRFTHEKSVRQASFSSDGKHVLTASDDHTARLWDAATGREVFRFSHLDRDAVAVLQALYSPDGRSVATASNDRTARVWDVATGTERARLNHEGTVLSVAFSPDSRLLLTVASDRTARLWDIGSGRELTRLAYASFVRAAFAPDRLLAATAAHDTVRIWDVTAVDDPTQRLDSRVCDWLPKDERHFAVEEIASDPLIRDVFLEGHNANRTVCGGSR